MLRIRSPELIYNLDQHLLVSPLAPLIGPALYLILPLPFLPSDSSSLPSLALFFFQSTQRLQQGITFTVSAKRMNAVKAEMFLFSLQIHLQNA